MSAFARQFGGRAGVIFFVMVFAMLVRESCRSEQTDNCRNRFSRRIVFPIESMGSYVADEELARRAETKSSSSSCEQFLCRSPAHSLRPGGFRPHSVMVSPGQAGVGGSSMRALKEYWKLRKTVRNAGYEKAKAIIDKHMFTSHFYVRHASNGTRRRFWEAHFQKRVLLSLDRRPSEKSPTIFCVSSSRTGRFKIFA